MALIESTSISCPISAERVNENVIRVIASIVIIISIITILNEWFWLAYILSIDFLLRAIGYKKYSLLALIANQIVSIAKLKEIKTDAAPKKFAAGVGFIFTSLIGSLLLFELSVGAIILTGILLFCAILESAFNYCMGCYVYSLIQKIKKTT